MAILESRTQTGKAWAKESFALFKQAPRSWILLAIIYIFLLMILTSIPIIQFIIVPFFPLCVALIMRRCRKLDLNNQETLAEVIAAVKPKLMPLILLGLISIAYHFLVAYLLKADMLTMNNFLQNAGKLSPEQASASFMPFFIATTKIALLLLPMMMVLWFSPMLIAFNQYNLLDAIKSSIAGAIQYMVAMGLAWLILMIGVTAVIAGALLVAVLVGLISAGLAQVLVVLVLFNCLLFSTALMLAFQYITYRDIYRAAPGM